MTTPGVKVSAMILTYNHERFIGQAIEGFLTQKTDFPCELVVIDDCSTDGTRGVIRRYWEKWPDRIRVILNRHNIGARASIARAYTACRGEYVAAADGDDYWVRSDKLQRQADFLDTHPGCAMCFHSVTMVWDDGQRESTVLRPPRIQEVYVLRDLLECNFIQSCSPMYRRGLFVGHPVWVFLTPAMDWAHHLLHAQYGDIGYIDEPMGNYRQHSRGVYSSLATTDKLKVSIECLRRFRCVLDGVHRRTIARSLSAYCLEVARIYQEEGDVARCRTYARDCIVESVYAMRILDYPLLRALLAIYMPGLYRGVKRLSGNGVKRGQIS